MRCKRRSRQVGKRSCSVRGRARLGALHCRGLARANIGTKIHQGRVLRMITFANETERLAHIKVVGVGGGGGNAVNTMIAAGVQGVEFLTANTDLQALESTNAA